MQHEPVCHCIKTAKARLIFKALSAGLIYRSRRASSCQAVPRDVVNVLNRQRPRRSFAFVLVVLVGAGISACGSTSNAAASFNAGWAQEAARVVSRVRDVTPVRPLAAATSTDMKSLRRSVDDAFARAPSQALRTAQDAAVVKQLIVVREFQTLVVEADVKRLLISSDADEVAARSTVDQRVRGYLKKHGEEILQDAACDAAFALMTPGEREEAKESGGEPYVKDLVVDPAEGAITSYGQRVLAGVFGPNVLQLVRWGQWGKGIAEKAQKFNNGLGGTIENPNQYAGAPNITRAYVNYARICLRLPG